jgi:hypothetical protein
MLFCLCHSHSCLCIHSSSSSNNFNICRRHAFSTFPFSVQYIRPKIRCEFEFERKCRKKCRINIPIMFTSGVIMKFIPPLWDYRNASALMSPFFSDLTTAHLIGPAHIYTRGLVLQKNSKHTLAPSAGWNSKKNYSKKTVNTH